MFPGDWSPFVNLRYRGALENKCWPLSFGALCSFATAPFWRGVQSMLTAACTTLFFKSSRPDAGVARRGVFVNSSCTTTTQSSAHTKRQQRSSLPSMWCRCWCFHLPYSPDLSLRDLFLLFSHTSKSTCNELGLDRWNCCPRIHEDNRHSTWKYVGSLWFETSGLSWWQNVWWLRRDFI